jgi:hypothetical protein
MKMKSLSHIFVDVENSAGLEVNNLEVFMANCNTKFSQKIAFISQNTPVHLCSKWHDTNFQIIKAGSDADAADYFLKDRIVSQVIQDKRANRETGKIYLVVTGDSDYCNLLELISELGWEIHIIGWGDINPALSEIATSSVNLKSVKT